MGILLVGSVLILVSGILGFLTGRSCHLCSLPDDYGDEYPFDDDSLHTNYNTGERCRCGLAGGNDHGEH